MPNQTSIHTRLQPRGPTNSLERIYQIDEAHAMLLPLGNALYVRAVPWSRRRRRGGLVTVVTKEVPSPWRSC